MWKSDTIFEAFPSHYKDANCSPWDHIKYIQEKISISLEKEAFSALLTMRLKSCCTLGKITLQIHVSLQAVQSSHGTRGNKPAS